MASTTHSLVTQARDIATKDTSDVRTPETVPNGRLQTKPSKSKPRSKYKHIAALHRESRSSVLSHDSKETPSFLGFRNLMVLTISTQDKRTALTRASFTNKTGSCHEFEIGR